MSKVTALGKMEALGAIMERLLVELEKEEVLLPEKTDALLKEAADSLIANEAFRTRTREGAREYVELLQEFVRKRRSEG